jgi:hypothetical protein
VLLSSPPRPPPSTSAGIPDGARAGIPAGPCPLVIATEMLVECLRVYVCVRVVLVEERNSKSD